jgi:hypothetical protein
VASSSATRVILQLALFSGLLCRALVCPAADGVGIVRAAHGPQMMLYIQQPLGVRGASLIYGLRLERLAPAPTLPSPVAIASTGRREIVDLQIRRYSDVRVEFGRRLTWNVGRQEFGLSGHQGSMAIRLPGHATSTAITARALP